MPGSSWGRGAVRVCELLEAVQLGRAQPWRLLRLKAEEQCLRRPVEKKQSQALELDCLLIDRLCPPPPPADMVKPSSL